MNRARLDYVKKFILVRRNELNGSTTTELPAGMCRVNSHIQSFEKSVIIRKRNGDIKWDRDFSNPSRF